MKSAQSVSAFVQENRNKIHAIQTKLQRLLDGYLEQDIERKIYREQKAKLLSEKKSLEEQIIKLEQKQNDWLEPLFGEPRRARRASFPVQGGAKRRRNGKPKRRKFDIGAGYESRTRLFSLGS